MQLPKPRFGGPVQGRDATILISLAAFMITARIPMGFALLALGPLAVVVVQGLRRSSGLPLRRLWALVGSLVACSLLSCLLLHRSELATLRSSLTTAIVVALVAVGCLLTGRSRRALDRLLDGVYLGLLFHWLVSMGEALTGIKLLPILYPGANTTDSVTAHRFYVTSMFPNYNDYSVAMSLLVQIVVVKMLFRSRVHPLVTAGRLLVALSATFEIAYMGSRGATAAVLLMVLGALVMAVRILHPRAMGIRSLVLAVVLGGVAAGGLFLSPLVQDHSTSQRGVIAGRILEMMLHSPLDAILGWGSFPSYQAAAATVYGSALMDPHNLLLEIIVWFGLPSLLLYLACWWLVLRRGFLAVPPFRDWRAVSAVIAVVTYPLLGVVCSSTLRYYLVWLFLVVALGRLALARRGNDEARQLTS